MWDLRPPILTQWRDHGARLVHTGGHAFRAEDTDGYASHGEPVVFELDAAGRARRMRVGENALDAVDAW